MTETNAPAASTLTMTDASGRRSLTRTGDRSFTFSSPELSGPIEFPTVIQANAFWLAFCLN